MPARFASATAEGIIKKLIVLILALGAVIALITFYEPFAQGYEIKNAAKIACNVLVRNWRSKIEGEENAHIGPFLDRARQAGVNLKPSQYSFVPSHDLPKGEFVCKVRVTYSTTTDWFLVGPIFEVPPLKKKYVLNIEHRVRDAY